LHQTRDKQLVVHHDLTLSRTTTGRGLIAWKRAPELKRLRLKGPQGQVTDQTLPFLSEVLDLLPDRPDLMVELKRGPLGPYSGFAPWRGFVNRVIETLRERGALERTWLASSSTRYLREAHFLAPGLRCELPGRERLRRPSAGLGAQSSRGFAFVLIKAEALASWRDIARGDVPLLRFAILPNRLREEEAKELVSVCTSIGFDGILTDSLRWRDYAPRGGL